MNTYSLKNVRRQFEDLCESYGYNYSSIPMFADASLYEKYKGINDNKYVKFIDRNAQVKVIRPDATFHVLKNISEDLDIDIISSTTLQKLSEKMLSIASMA